MRNEKKADLPIGRRLAALCATLVLACICVCAASAEDAVSHETGIWVLKSEENGLDGDVRLTGSDDTYILYLPGNADAEKCCLSWFGMTLAKDGTPSVNGAEKIPAVGQSAEYTLKYEDGTAKTVTVRTMQGSADVLPIFLTISADPVTIDGEETVDFATLNDSKHANADKALLSAGRAAVGGESYYISLKGRGNSSWQYLVQKSFNLKFYEDGEYDKKNKVSLLEGVETNKYSLISSSTDGSLMRNKLAYDLAAEMGVGVKCRYVDLWIDGEYRGVYLLTEKNDAMTPKGGYAVEYDNRVDADEHQLQLSGLHGKNGKDGFLTVKENDNKNEPKDANGERGYTWIDAYLTRAWDALRDTDSERYQDYFDLESWAKYYLLEEFVKDSDSVGSSYMYLEGLSGEDDESVKLKAGPLWDMDHALGCNYGAEYYNTTGWYLQNRQQQELFWLGELDNHESFLREVERQRLIWSDTLLAAPALAAGCRELLEASAQMHVFRWSHPAQNYWSTRLKQDLLSDDGTFYRATKTWSNYVDNLLTYVTYRAEYVCNTPIVQASREESALTNTFAFRDTIGHWAAGSIAFAVRRGILKGADDGRFLPDATITRGMIAAVLWRMEGEPAAPKRAFADVASDAYYAAGAAWAVANGVIAEREDGKFLPEQALTREELAVILYRYAKAIGVPVDAGEDLNAFSDAENISEAALDAMRWAVAVGLLKGGDSDALNPNGAVTRAETAALLQRFACYIAPLAQRSA